MEINIQTKVPNGDNRIGLNMEPLLPQCEISSDPYFKVKRTNFPPRGLLCRTISESY